MDSMLNLTRAFAAVTICILLLSLVARVGAQVPPPNLPVPGGFQAMPDYVGTNAGLSFRNAINDRFSGAQPTSPKIVNLHFANLPSEEDGLLIFCRDCQPTIPCSNSGPGAWAFGQNGAWTCTAPNVPGNVLYQGQSGVQLNDLSASVNGNLNLKSTPFNARADAQMTVDGAITAASHLLTGSSAPFRFTDVGKSIIVGGAGGSGAVLQTTISSFTSSSQVTLAAAAGT